MSILSNVSFVKCNYNFQLKKVIKEEKEIEIFLR